MCDAVGNMGYLRIESVVSWENESAYESANGDCTVRKP